MVCKNSDADQVFSNLNNNLISQFRFTTITMSFARIFLFWMIPIKLISGAFWLLSFSKKKAER